MITVEPRNPDSRQAYADQGGLTYEERQRMALMHALGLWDAAAIARAFGVTRHSVYRAARHFVVSG